MSSLLGRSMNLHLVRYLHCRPTHLSLTPMDALLTMQYRIGPPVRQHRTVISTPWPSGPGYSLPPIPTSVCRPMEPLLLRLQRWGPILPFLLLRSASSFRVRHWPLRRPISPIS